MLKNRIKKYFNHYMKFLVVLCLLERTVRLGSVCRLSAGGLSLLKGFPSSRLHLLLLVPAFTTVNYFLHDALLSHSLQPAFHCSVPWAQVIAKHSRTWRRGWSSMYLHERSSVYTEMPMI